MNKELSDALKRLEKAKAKYDEQYARVDAIVSEMCDFEGGLTFCDGDGHLVINVSSETLVAPFACMCGFDRGNKISAEEHKKWCI